MLSGGIDTTGLAGSPRTRRGGVEVRRRQGNTLTPTPRNFRPGSPAGSWSSGPALGRTSSPLSQSLSCERRRGGCASFHARARRFLSPAGRHRPRLRGSGRHAPHRSPCGPPPPRAWSRPSWRSARLDSLGATAAGGSLVPRDAAAFGTGGRRGLCGAGLGRRPRARSPPASALAAFAFRGFGVERR